MDDKLEKINYAATRLIEAQTLDSLFITIVKEALSLTESDYSSIFIQCNSKLEKIFSTSPFVEKVKIKKQGYIYKSLETDKIIILGERELQDLYYFKNTPVKSIIIIPLLYHHEPIGVLTLQSQDINFFNEEKQKILKLYTSMASIAIKKTQLYNQTQKALEMRDRFISLASHELRTPLTSMNGYVQLLYRKMAKKHSPEARWVEELNSECTRLTHLIKELLDVNRIKQGQLEFILSEIDLSQVVQKAIERYRFINSDVAIDFNNNITEGNCMIIGDYDKLLQMTSALLSNAVKFSKPSSKVTVSIASNNRFIHMKIKDEGKGIPKDLTQIFDGFYKGGDGVGEGIGLGLLLAKHIVSRHRGKIEITSKENKGTTIEVELPKARI